MALFRAIKHGLQHGRGMGALSSYFHLELSKKIFNVTEELEASAGYNDIRFTVLSRVTSEVEEQDIEPQVSIPKITRAVTILNN